MHIKDEFTGEKEKNVFKITLFLNIVIIIIFTNTFHMYIYFDIAVQNKKKIKIDYEIPRLV